MLPAKESDIISMFNRISPTYDKVNRILSFGCDIPWRKKLIRQIPAHCSDILDVATGTGDILIEAQKKRNFRKCIGLDPAENMLEIARIKARSAGKEIDFVLGNALHLPFDTESFDAVTIGFGIRNVRDPLKGLKEFYRVLREKGRLLILEFSLPKNIVIKKGYLFYLRHFLPKIGAAVSEDSVAYTYLNKTIETFPSGKEFLQLMETAGFRTFRAIPLTFGVVTLYLGEK